MISYHNYEKQIYDWMLSKREKDNKFTFSLRQMANKGSEKDYFIGTSKSNYFGTTFWKINVGFPGSSGDCINLIFMHKGDKFQYQYEFKQTNSPGNEQNKSALNLIKHIQQPLKDGIGLRKDAKPENKMFSMVSKPQKKQYESIDKMIEDVSRYLEIILPIVDEGILKEKQSNPDFVAHRITSAEFQQMQDWMEERFEKFKNLDKKVTDDDSQIKQQKDSIDSIEDIDESYKKVVNTPLNQILYGPPGTGKTYNTITKAISILRGESFETVKYEERAKIKIEFDDFISSNQILFTTFHQAMSYEDFVEGIKPVINEDNERGTDSISYEIKPGIFKIACARAAFNAYAHNQTSSTKAYTFGALYNDFIEMLRDGIGSDNLFTCSTKNGSIVEVYNVNKNDSIKARAKGSHGTHVAPLTKENLQKLYDAYKSIDEIDSLQEVRDVVGVSPRTTEFYAVFKALLEFEKNKYIPSEETVNLSIGQIEDDELVRQFESGVFDKYVKEFGVKATPVVLIIDEINRGNVSSIFGELITLLEEDKRIGKDNSLTVKLPYSKSDFAVPPNLYLIGTMNTADRSVEALDTALRRRFSFQEIMPNPIIISEVVEGISLRDVLMTINERIEVLIDRDHTIGHSYFMGVDSLDELKLVFKDKIIPLLQEYFYGDYGKIGLVLGKGFVVRQKKKENLFASFDYERQDELNNEFYKLIPMDESFSIIDAVTSLIQTKEPTE